VNRLASKREMEALIVLTGKLSPSLRAAMMSTNKQMDSVGKTATLSGNLINKAFSFAAKGVALGAAAIGVGMIAVAKQGLDLASSLTEVQNVVDVTFGNGAKQIDAWSQTALKSYGLSELSAKQYSSTIGAMMKSSGISSKSLVSMSENMTALAGDFASFYNLDPGAAFEKIQSGLSGETEPLKQLGINMSVANLQAYALAHGIKTSYDKMSQADQTILRYNFLLEKSADAQGDFARTQDSFANQQRLMKESFKQLSGTVMKAALPAMTGLFKKVNQLISSFANSPDKVAKLQAVIAGIADKVVAFFPVAVEQVKRFVGFLGQLYDGAVQVYQFISDNWSTLEPIIIGIVAAMAAWKVITVGMKIYKAVMTSIRGVTLLASAAQWLLNTAVLANPMTWIIVGIVAAVAGLVAAIIWLWNNWSDVSGWIVGLWQNNILPFFQGIGDWFGGLFTGMVDGFKSAWSGITGWFSGLWDGIIGIFKGYVNTYVWIFNKIISAINSVKIDIPDWVPGMGGKSFGVSIPNIPTFAQGGFANRASIFGEAGPEAAIPLKRTPRSLSLLNKTAQVLGVGGGSGSPQFVFAPVIGGNGGGSIMSDLKTAGEDFFAQADRWWESKRRESFG
jgi:hypothetical protein